MTDEIEDRGDNDLTLVIESQDFVIKTLKQDNAALLLEKGEWQSDRVKLNGTEQLVADLTKKLTEIISPRRPNKNSVFPTTASHPINGKTAAAVQSTDAAEYPIPHRYIFLLGVNNSSLSSLV